MSEIIRWFWKIRYFLYNRDLYPGLREGRGSTKDNPLRKEDLLPLMKALRRIEKPTQAGRSEEK